MKLLGSDDGHADLRIGIEELILLHTALQEICHGFQLSDRDFQEILGVQRGEATALLRRFGGVLDRLDVLEQD
jgi:hypothetical protein